MAEKVELTEGQIKDMQELKVMASEIIANTSSSNAQQIRNQMAAAISGGYDFADTLHNIYLDYGYPGNLSFFNYWNMYKRFGIAKNLVEKPVNDGWVTPPTIEAADAFVKELEKLNRRIKLWNRMKGLDTRQRIGTYAGMFMRVKDNNEPKEPLEKVSGQAALMEMLPLYESQLKITKTDKDPKSERYGQPILIEYNQGAIGSTNQELQSSITIHYSRIVFVAEGSDNGWIYGTSALEAGYNSLMDLRKIIGGGAEGFYKNAAQNIVFDLKNPENASGFKEKLDEFNEQYDDFAQNRFRRAMWTPGMEATTLDSKLMNPKEFFMNALNDVAASGTPVVPATILIGMQTGRLASTEDGKSYLTGVQSRREDFQTDLVSALLDWMIQYGVMPSAEYEVVWDDLLARSDSEKLDAAEKMASINEKQARSGGEIPYDGDEIRDASGHEKRKLEEPGSEDIDDEDFDD